MTISDDTPKVDQSDIEAIEAIANGAKVPRLDKGLRSNKRMAYRFSQKFRGTFLNTPGRGWMEFNGNFWQECGESRPWNAVESVCRDALRELADVDSKEDRDRLYADVRECDKAGGTRGVLEFAKHWPGIGVRDEDLDAKPGLFAVKNGTIDLYRYEFRASDPADLLTLAGGCDFDPDATCPFYDSLIEQYQPQQDVRDYLHRLGGAAMEGRQNLQNLVTWFGSTGGNGKGTTMRAWQAVFGTYARVMPVEALIARKGSADAYRDEKAQLKGSRLVFATEPSQGARFDTGVVKSITGGDRVKARAVYKSAIEFDPTWLIIMPTNTRVSTPNDGGMARRLKEIPWTFQVPEGQERNDIDGILAGEASGILNRLLAGWKAYYDGGIAHPESVEKATAEYLAEVDPIANFLEECVQAQPGMLTASSVLYKAYVNWCDEQGTFATSNKVFSESLQKPPHHKEKKRQSGGWFWIGIVLTS